MLPAALPAPFSTTLSLALSVYVCANVGPHGLLVVRLPALLVPHSTSLGPAMATGVLSAPVPVSAPPTGLDECVFFISLVVGVAHSSIFWLFFVFKLSFWSFKEAQCVYLCLHLGQKSKSEIILM